MVEGMKTVSALKALAAWAAALRDLIENDALRRALAARCRAVAPGLADWDRQALLFRRALAGFGVR